MERVKTEEYEIICGDCLEVLPGVPESSIPLIVTSPPYWKARDYGGGEAEIGARDDYPEFLEKLKRVWIECERILKPGGRLVVNIGEMFFRQGPKSLVTYTSILVDVILAFRDLGGMQFAGKILWVKNEGNHNYRSMKRMYGSYPYPPNLLVTNANENLLIFRKSGNDNVRSPEIKERSKFDKVFIDKFSEAVWHIGAVRIPKSSSVWQHTSPYPLEVPERFIRAFSFWGDWVLDPFAGRGTTLMAARKWGRRAIGIDLVRKNFELMKLNLSQERLKVECFG